MTLTLSCACYTNTPTDLGLHNRTCNCELNLSTVVSLIRDNFMLVYHCVFLTFIILYCVGLRTILRLFLLSIVWMRLSTIIIKRK